MDAAVVRVLELDLGYGPFGVLMCVFLLLVCFEGRDQGEQEQPLHGSCDRCMLQPWGGQSPGGRLLVFEPLLWFFGVLMCTFLLLAGTKDVTKESKNNDFMGAAIGGFFNLGVVRVLEVACVFLNFLLWRFRCLDVHFFCCLSARRP